MRRLTTEDLKSEVRSLLDEKNANTITDADILSALNRAQDTCINTLATGYEDPLLMQRTYSVTSDLTIPDCLEDRIEKVEILFGGQYYPVTRISYRDIHMVNLTSQSTIPQYYYVQGRTATLLPVPSAAVSARVWYLKDPLPLADLQGRVTAIGADYVIVDKLGSDLVDSVSDLNSYISVIDGATGEVRASFQILKIEGTQKIVLKAAPTRSSVLGYAVSGASSLASSGAILDDYVCIHGNTCIPFLKKPVANAMIYLAVADLKGTKLNQDVTLDTQKAMSFLRRVETTWSGRESTSRIRNNCKSFKQRSTSRRNF
jgi:hypothetical protein